MWMVLGEQYCDLGWGKKLELGVKLNPEHQGGKREESCGSDKYSYSKTKIPGKEKNAFEPD